MSRFHRKIMGALTVLVLVVGATFGILAERGLRDRVLAQIQTSLRERAALVANLIEGVELAPGNVAALDRLADRASVSAEARVTLIDSQGIVLGDSDISLGSLGTLANHRERPEVAKALGGEMGVSTRRSDTVLRPLLYLALPVSGGVVRLAVDLEAIDAAVAVLRFDLVTALAVGLVAALALSFAISWLGLRPLTELRDVMESIAHGELSRRLHWRTHDELGEIAASIDLVADRLDEQLRETRAGKEQLELVLESMVEGVIVLDGDGCIQLANPRSRELLDLWSPMQGRRAIEVLRIPKLQDALGDASKGEGPQVCEIEVGGDAGRILLVHAVSFSPSATREGTVAVFHDVTEVRRLERVRQDFISNASHELRTPVTSIRGFADTLLSHPPGEEERNRYLEVILRNSERMSNLIEDLLELSRAESRKEPLLLDDQDVGELARTLVGDLQPRLEEAKIEVSVELDAAEGPVTVWADRRALERILLNLVDNAIKYSEVGGHVWIRAGRDAGRVHVAVEDSGIGIPEAERGRIFERFYRVNQARSRAIGGTGLGLSIVRHLVQRMGGEVMVAGREGGGTRFTVYLPSGSAAQSA